MSDPLSGKPIERAPRIVADVAMAAPAAVEEMEPEIDLDAPSVEKGRPSYLDNMRAMVSAKSIGERIFNILSFGAVLAMIVAMVMKLMSPAALDGAVQDGTRAVERVIQATTDQPGPDPVETDQVAPP